MGSSEARYTYRVNQALFANDKHQLAPIEHLGSKLAAQQS